MQRRTRVRPRPRRPAAGSSTAAVICGLALLLGGGAQLAAAQEAAQEAAQKCIEYEPSTCWFALPADPKKEPIVFPRCAFHDCEFDHAAALVCPFPSSGTFAVKDSATCRDFMKVEQRQLPDCEAACCGGVVPGNFTHPPDDPPTHDYRADAGADCQYFDYRRQEVVDKLLGEGIDIVVAGDSMMRQNYLRLLQLMRGRHRVFDYRVHTHASYSYCDEADSFRTASYMADMKQPEKKYLLDVVPEFFDRADDKAKRGALSACTRDVGRLDFLHAPLFATHGAVVEAYLAAAKASGRKLVVFSYVGVWTKVANIPDHYFQTLDKIAAHPPGAAVVAISVPTFKEVRAPERAAKYRERNSKMRAWVETRPGKAAFLDFESLSLTPGAPPNTRNDKHYMCYVTWPQPGRGGPQTASLRAKMLEVNSFRERLYDNPVGNLWMTEDGECYDEMNRALWMVALNTIMQAGVTKDGDFELPRAFETIPPPIYAREEMGLSASELPKGKSAAAGGKDGKKRAAASASGPVAAGLEATAAATKAGGDEMADVKGDASPRRAGGASLGTTGAGPGGGAKAQSAGGDAGASASGQVAAGLEATAAAAEAGGANIDAADVSPGEGAEEQGGGGGGSTVAAGLDATTAAMRTGGDEMADVKEEVGPRRVGGASVGTAGAGPNDGAEAQSESGGGGSSGLGPRRSSNIGLEAEEEEEEDLDSTPQAADSLEDAGDGITSQAADSLEEEEEEEPPREGGSSELEPADVSADITDEIDDSQEQDVESEDAIMGQDGEIDDTMDQDDAGSTTGDSAPPPSAPPAAKGLDAAALAQDAAKEQSEARVNADGEALGETDFETLKVAGMEATSAAAGAGLDDSSEEGGDGATSAAAEQGEPAAGANFNVEGETAPLLPEDEN